MVAAGSIARELGCPAQLIFAIFAIVAYSARWIDPGSLRHSTGSTIRKRVMLSPAVFPTVRGTIDRPHCVLGTRIPTVIAVSPAAADFLRNTLRSLRRPADHPRLDNFVYRKSNSRSRARSSKEWRSLLTTSSFMGVSHGNFPFSKVTWSVECDLGTYGICIEEM